MLGYTYNKTPSRGVFRIEKLTTIFERRISKGVVATAVYNKLNSLLYVVGKNMPI